MESATFTQTLIDELESKLTPRRFLHVLGVVHTAVALAMRHGADPEQAAFAALLHDISKPLHPDQIERDLARWGMEISEDDRGHPAIWHGLHAAARIGRELSFPAGQGLDEIEEAVRLHSTADAGVGMLTKVLFLADALEPTRWHEGIESLRQVAIRDLDEAFRLALEKKCENLEKSGKPPSLRAKRALQHYAQRRGEV